MDVEVLLSKDNMKTDGTWCSVMTVAVALISIPAVMGCCVLSPRNEIVELTGGTICTSTIDSHEGTVRIVSLNVHALPFSFSAERRMRVIGRWLEDSSQAPLSIVCLQEAFGDASVFLGRNGLRGGVVFDFGAVGSGLMTWSKTRHYASRFVRFRYNGSPFDVWRGDWYAGKGIGVLRFSIGGGMRLAVANVHAIAKYVESDPYLKDRISQARQMRQTVEEELEVSDVVALVGDYNFPKGSPEWDELQISNADVVVPCTADAIDHVVLFTRPGFGIELLDHQYSSELLEQDMTDHPSVTCKVRIRRQ
jgi:hypothetical protein